MVLEAASFQPLKLESSRSWKKSLACSCSNWLKKYPLNKIVACGCAMS